jgi:biopolymer transport protein ExbD
MEPWIRKRRKAEVNIVPLVDVLIVLIFFFLFFMQFRTSHLLNISLPKIETAGKNRLVESIEISISKEGVFYYNSNQTTLSELNNLLGEAAKSDLKTPVIIHADEDSFLKHITSIMDACRKVGLDKIRLQSK